MRICAQALPSEKGVFQISQKQLLTARLHQAGDPQSLLAQGSMVKTQLGGWNQNVRFTQEKVKTQVWSSCLSSTAKPQVTTPDTPTGPAVPLGRSTPRK